MVKFGEGLGELAEMKSRKAVATAVKPDTKVSAVRATISFPYELYETLEGIAKEKKVSLAWVVREATEQYVAEKWPLFRGRG